MQLTVFSQKLENQTDEQFEHEFRVVHAAETRKIASSLGLISRYVQGVSLQTTAKTLTNASVFPDNTPRQPHSVAQLTWPSAEVLGASLHTQGYKDSAGKHVFATTSQVFMTERLEPDRALDTANMATAVLLTIILIPADNQSDDEFRTKWDQHAAIVRDKIPSYQRNIALPLSPQKVESILHDTAFTPSLCVSRGGYEELVFPTLESAQSFLDKHAHELRESYRDFAGEQSYLASFDHAIVYSEEDRTFKQMLTGALVSNILWAKTILGL